MSIEPGVHPLGPENATLSVRTGRTGAAAKAGHDLLIHVTAWEASLTVGEGPGETSVELSADATSLRVHEGTGGMKALSDDDLADIHKAIDDKILKRKDITFRSTRADGAAGGRIGVEGDLTVAGKTEPIAFDLDVGDDGSLSAAAAVTQTAWGIKPYSALFGSLKVADDVEVVLDGHL